MYANKVQFDRFLTMFTRKVNGWIFLGLIGLHLMAHAVEWGIKTSGVILIAYSATASLWFLQSECREKKWVIEDNGMLFFGLASFGLCLGAAVLGNGGFQMSPSEFLLAAFSWIIAHILAIRIRGSMMTWADGFGMRT